MISELKKLTLQIPFYKNYEWDGAWENIPILDKKTVHSNYQSLLSPRKNEDLIFNRTSGSSGIILTIPWIQKESMFALKRMWDFRRKFDVNLSDLYVTCHAHYYLGSRILNNKIINIKQIEGIKLSVLTKMLLYCTAQGRAEGSITFESPQQIKLHSKPPAAKNEKGAKERRTLKTAKL